MRRHRSSKLILSWFILAIIPFTALAESPVLLNLSRFTGALLLRYQNTDESFKVEDQIISDMNRNFFEYGLNLNLSGNVYHSGLLTFNIDFKILSYNTKEILFSDSSTNNDLNDTYNITLSFLNNRKINFSVFALKDYNSADRKFNDRFFTRYKKSGLSAVNISKLFPFRVEIYKMSRISESLSYRDREESSDNLEFDLTLVKHEKSRSDFRLRWQDYAESVFNNEYTTLDMFADYYLFYGKNSENIFSSVISYRKMISAFTLETLSLSSTVNHYLFSDLTAVAVYSFQRNKYSYSANTLNSLEMAVRHKLFKSLNTELNSGFNSLNSEYQDYKRIHAGFRGNYKKSIRNGFINVSYAARITDGNYYSNSAIAESSQVVSFSFSDSIILSIYGVKKDSVRVMDKDLVKLYVEGIDYEVSTDGISLIIVRIPGGDIPPGKSVRIVYQYLSYPDYKSDLNYSNLNLSISFLKYFRVLYQNERNDQKIHSEFLIRPFEDFSREKYGVNFTSRFFSVSYLTEKYFSSISGYNADNFNFTARAPLFRIMNVNASYYSNSIDYFNGELFGNFRALMGEISVTPTRNITTRFLYRKLNYETFSSDRFRESLIVKLNWRIRKILIDLYYEHILNSFGLSSDRHNYISIMIRRTF